MQTVKEPSSLAVLGGQQCEPGGRLVRQPTISWGLYPSHLSLAALIDGYLDVIVYERFGVYCTMMTGNLISVGVAIGHLDALRFLFLLVVIITYFSGYYAMLLVLHWLMDDKRKTYALVLPTQVAGVLVLAFAAAKYDGWKVFYLTPLVFSYGLLNCWATKFGYTPNMVRSQLRTLHLDICVQMTGNMQKMTEVCFKCAHGVELSAKERGDAVIMGLEIASYLLGAVSASILQHYASQSSPDGANGPLLVVLPIICLKLLASRTVLLPSIKLPDFVSRLDSRLYFTAHGLQHVPAPRNLCDNPAFGGEV